jgi:hypothetical protein
MRKKQTSLYRIKEIYWKDYGISDKAHYYELSTMQHISALPYLINFTGIINRDLQKIEFCEELNGRITS